MRALRIWLATGLLILVAACSEQSAPVEREPVVPKLEPRISVGLFLRDRLPTDTALYARIPSPWGLYAAPNGRVLDAAYVHPQHVAAIEQIRQALIAEPALNEGPASVARLLLAQWSGPLELVLLAPGRNVGPNAQVMISMPLAGFANGQALAEVMRKAGGPPLQFDAQGYAALPNGALHFDAGQGRLLLLGGTAVDTAALKTRIDKLQAAAPVFAASEARIDQSGQGLYLWLDLVSLRSAISMAAMQAGDAAAFINRFAADAKSASLGFGTVNGKGRMAFEIEAPGAGFLRYLPRESRQMSVRSAGTPTYAGSMSLLFSPAEFEQLRAAIKEDAGAEAADKFDQGLAEMKKALGFALTDVWAALGPDLLFFGDVSGDFMALKVRDRQAWDQLLATLGALPAAKLSRNGDIQLLELGSATAAPAATDGIAGMFLRMRSRVYWVDEGDYLVFGSTPQELRDRQADKPAFALDAWFKAERGPQYTESLLMIAGPTRDVARRTYYFGLGALHGLGDLSGAVIDPFSFASARELDLPRDGVAGMGLEVSADRLALVLSHDITGLDLFAGQSGGSSTITVIAVGGILAAIALPAYQDYIARAQVAESVAMAGAAKIAVAEHYLSTGELPESLEALGVDGELRYGQLSWENGVLLLRLGESAPTTERLRGQTLAIALKSDGSWLCGYSQDWSEGDELVGDAPAELTSAQEKLLPASCR